jgi:oxygen-dependent protoporphyrinogen oxidase
MRHVAVVGGGLAGLTAAAELTERSRSVTVLEASGRFGGQIATERRDGFVIEQGAEGFLARSAAVAELCARIGITAGLVTQATRRTLAWREGRLLELRDGEAAGLLGIPVDPEELGRGLQSLSGGMEDLIEALLRNLRSRARLHTEARVSAIRRDAGAWQLDCAGGESHTADAVILAVPPRDAQVLFEPLLGARLLNGQIHYGSTLTVTLAYTREAVAHPLDASGFVVDSPECEGLRACTFSSSKFPGRAPHGWCLLRAFFTPEPARVEESDGEWSERAHRVLAPILGLSGNPERRWVCRWPAALPRYSPGHAAAVASLRARLARHGPIDCAGGALEGGGIDGAVRSGLVAARKLAERD